MNESPSVFMTKPTASPCAPQPKQWKKPFLSLTVKDGVFSLWKGQRPEYSAPDLRFSVTLRPTMSDRMRRARNSSRKPGGKAMHQCKGRLAPNVGLGYPPARDCGDCY